MAREYVKELGYSVEVSRDEKVKTKWLNDFTAALVYIIRHPEQELAYGLDNISDRVNEEMERWCLLPVAPSDFEIQCVKTELGNWLYERAEEYFNVGIFRNPERINPSEDLVRASLDQVVWSEIAEAAIKGTL